MSEFGAHFNIHAAIDDQLARSNSFEQDTTDLDGQMKLSFNSTGNGTEEATHDVVVPNNPYIGMQEPQLFVLWNHAIESEDWGTSGQIEVAKAALSQENARVALTTNEISSLRAEAKAAGIPLPASDDELQIFIHNSRNQ